MCITLVLSRTTSQSITLTLPVDVSALAGATITISVERVSSGVVRFGFEADRSIAIVRTELLDHTKGAS